MRNGYRQRFRRLPINTRSDSSASAGSRLAGVTLTAGAHLRCSPLAHCPCRCDSPSRALQERAQTADVAHGFDGIDGLRQLLRLVAADDRPDEIARFLDDLAPGHRIARSAPYG